MSETIENKDSQNSAQQRTVLFIDDEFNILRSLQRALQLESFQVRTTSSPSKALKIIEEEPIHVIVADLKMPKMHGLELLERARKIRPDAIRLVLSAVDDSKTILSAINKGEVYRYIVKPWDTVELVFTIQQALDLYDLREEKNDLLRRLEEHNQCLEERVRERTEQLLAVERKAEIGKYASQIVHNLGNPLQVVLGGIDLLELRLQGDGPLYQDLANYIDMIKNSAINIGTIIGGILNYARESAPFQAEPIELNRVIHDQINFFMMNPLFKHKINRQVYLSEEIPRIRAVVIQVKQIMDNLIKNAIDAMERSEEKVLTLRTYMEEGDVCFEVTDTGEGIPEAHIEQLYSPDFTTKPVGKGTGLGLASVKTMVDAYQWDITIESKPNEGTTFVIRIPKESQVSRLEEIET